MPERRHTITIRDLISLTTGYCFEDGVLFNDPLTPTVIDDLSPVGLAGELGDIFDMVRPYEYSGDVVSLGRHLVEKCLRIRSFRAWYNWFAQSDHPLRKMVHDLQSSLGPGRERFMFGSMDLPGIQNDINKWVIKYRLPAVVTMLVNKGNISIASDDLMDSVGTIDNMITSYHVKLSVYDILFWLTGRVFSTLGITDVLTLVSDLIVSGETIRSRIIEQLGESHLELRDFLKWYVRDVSVWRTTDNDYMDHLRRAVKHFKLRDLYYIKALSNDYPNVVVGR